MNIIPFEQATLPAHILNDKASSFNADLTSHAAPSFPVASIKGKVFAIVRDGDRTMVMNPKDPDSPATYIDVVLMKANKATSKVFYIEGYDEKAEAKKPDCWSNDGVKPDSTSETPQATSCAACPHNQWGSRIGDDGRRKGKACADVVRLAIAAPDRLNDPMLLRVPPASIKSLAEYGQMLSKRGVDYNKVLTKVSFDMEAPTPKLMFKPVGFLSPEMIVQMKEIIETDLVKSIIGTVYFEDASPSAAPKVTPLAPTTPAPAPAAAAKAAPAPKKSNGTAKPPTTPPPEPEPATADVGNMDVSLNLSNLKFDD